MRFSAPVQTGPGADPASYTMGTGSFLGVKWPGSGVDHPPPSNAEVKEGVELYLYSPSGPSWPVLGRLLPLLSYVCVCVCAHVFMYSSRYLSGFNGTQIFSKDFRKNTQISNFMKIRPVGTELFCEYGRTDGRTDRHYEDNSHCFCKSENATKKVKILLRLSTDQFIITNGTYVNS
jgi:hypothetical protein